MVPVRQYEAKKGMGGPPGDMPKTRVKHDLYLKKKMICAWWDWEGMVHWKMLEWKATISKELYITQLYCVNEAIQ